MHLQELNLVNWCQHRDTTVKFEPGLNMLIGPNGAGKTNLLRALRLIFTGDAGGDCNKLQNIHQLVGKKAKAGVTGRMSHQNQEISVYRGLRPNIATLTIGEDNYDGATEVNDRLWSLLGVTQQQLDNYVFVEQCKIDALIDMKDTARATEFAELFGTTKAQKIWKAAGDFLRIVEVPTTHIDVPAMEASKTRLEGQLEAVEHDIKMFELPEDLDAYINERRELNQLFDKMNTMASEITTTNAELATLRGRLPGLEAVAAEAAGNVQTIDNAIEVQTPKARAARADLARWSTYRMLESARQQIADLQQEVANIEEAMPVEPSPPVDCPNETHFQEIKKSADALNADKITVVRAIAQMEGEATVCYACGKPLDDAADRADHLIAKREELMALDTKLAELDPALRAWATFMANLNSWTTAQSMLADRREQLEKLSTAGDAEAPNTSEEELTAAVTSLESFQKARHDLLDAQRVADGRVTETGDEIARLQKRADDIYEEMGRIGPRPSAEDAMKAQEEVASLRMRIQQRNDAEKQQLVWQTELSAVNKQLADAARIKREASAVRSTVKRMEAVRHVFHVNESPKVVSQTYLEQIEDQVNAVLSLFDADFMVRANDKLGFTAYFADGRVMSDRRLSRGQRIILSWAFRTVINSMFVGNLSLLIMDEPTDGLDADNLGCLPMAMERLRQMSEQRGLQVLLVTHAASLTQFANNVIQLSA
jgi:DNA repair exonuclease SbcCD ATPase subunit